MKVYRTSSEIDFKLDDCPYRPARRARDDGSPEHFDVQYVINPHMEGHIGSVDQRLGARRMETPA
jgi:hypothetical protein